MSRRSVWYSTVDGGPPSESRPRPRVRVRDQQAGVRVAGAEQRRPARVLGGVAVVVEPDERLQEPVEDEQVRRVGVNEVVSAAGGRAGDADRRGGLERGQRRLRDVAVAGHAGERVGAAEGLDAGALGHAAHPRRRAALEGEEVLPGREGAAAGPQRDHGVEQLAQLRAGAVAVALAGRPGGVGLAEVGQRLDLQAEARVVLEVHGRAAEHDARAGRGRLVGRPELGVAPERHGQGGQPRERELAARLDPLGGRDHRAQLRAARPAARSAPAAAAAGR